MRLPNVSGDHVALAFHLLAQGHNLRTLRILIKQGLSSELLAHRYFFWSYNLLRVALSQLECIKRLEWVNTADDILPPSPDPNYIETVDSARDELGKLKEDMESGYNTRAYVECSVPFTKKAVNQVDKAIRCHDLVSRMSTLNLPGRSPGASPYSYAAVWFKDR